MSKARHCLYWGALVRLFRRKNGHKIDVSGNTARVRLQHPPWDTLVGDGACSQRDQSLPLPYSDTGAAELGLSGLVLGQRLFPLLGQTSRALWPLHLQAAKGPRQEWLLF